MAKKTNKTKLKIIATRIGILTMGLDIGYGVVKAATDNASIAFPSVMGHAHEIKFQQKYPGDQIINDEGKWFVGDLAMAQVSSRRVVATARQNRQ